MWFDYAGWVFILLLYRSRPKIGLTGGLRSFSRSLLSLFQADGRWISIWYTQVRNETNSFWAQHIYYPFISPPQPFHSGPALSSQFFIFSLRIFCAVCSRFYISLFIINSKKPVRGTETGLVVLSGAGQRSQGMSSRAEKSGSEMFMSHIGQSTTADLK